MLRTRLAVAVLTAPLAAPTAGHAAPLVAPPSERADAPAVTGFAYGDLSRAALRRDAHALSTLTVDGVGLRADARSVTGPGSGAVRLGRAGRRLGLETQLLVHNYNDALGDFDPRRAHRLLSAPRRIEAVARQLARLVRAGGWDGVNVDIELVARGDADGLVALCAALQDALPPASVVTVDIGAATTLRGYRDRGYALAGLAAAVDRIELMSYDQHGPAWSGPGPVNALGWQRRALAALLRVVPAEQVDLGVAGYGYTWAPRGRGWVVTPATARQQARRAGVRPVWHPRSAEWSARLPEGRTTWWADARSYRQRVRLARASGVHGLALWRLGSADPLP